MTVHINTMPKHNSYLDRLLLALKDAWNPRDRGQSCPSVFLNRRRAPRGNRGHHFDLAVEDLAPTIRQLQSAGILDIRQLAQRLNDEGLLAPSGQFFSYGTMRRILLRLQELHLGLGPRTL